MFFSYQNGCLQSFLLELLNYTLEHASWCAEVWAITWRFKSGASKVIVNSSESPELCPQVVSLYLIVSSSLNSLLKTIFDFHPKCNSSYISPKRSSSSFSSPLPQKPLFFALFADIRCQIGTPSSSTYIPRARHLLRKSLASNATNRRSG